MSGIADLLPLALLGAVLGLDVVSFPQAMISRPLVSATLAGALVGHPEQGLLAGVVLELFALETLPFGASRYPEWGTASVVGGALLAMEPGDGAGALPVAVCAALVTAWAAGRAMILHRRLIARWAGALRDSLAAGSAEAVSALQLRGLVSDFLRGFLVAGLALALFAPIARAVRPAWSVAALPSRGLVVALALATAASAVWRVTHATRAAAWYLAAGLVAGVGLTLAR